MTRALVLAFAVTAVGCGQPPPAIAKVWTPKDFIAPDEDDLDFGGWDPRSLAVASGEVIPFTTERQTDGHGLPVRPGVFEGRAVGFVITDVWQNHPEPWIQPVWHLSTEAPVPVPRGLPSVFPIDVDSSFYSPWWRQVLVAQPDGEEPLRSAREVLTASHRLVETQSLILCPLVPDGVSLAKPVGSPVHHPLTGVALRAPQSPPASSRESR